MAPGMEPMPPKTGRDKGFETQHGPHHRGGLWIGAAVQDGAYAGERRAQSKCKGDGGVHTDAHKLRRAHILGDGAHGLAHFCFLNEQGQEGS